MPKCSISHPESSLIDSDIVSSGTTLRKTAERFGVSVAVVSRHKERQT